jgi:hypothetical protein
MIGKPPRYSLTEIEFPFRSLASLAGRAAVGGAREVVLATLVSARLAGSVLGAESLATRSRELRATGARNWLLSLALPQASRTLFMRVIEATGTDDIESLGRALAQVIELADPHLDHPSRLELGRLVHRISIAQSGEALDRKVTTK